MPSRSNVEWVAFWDAGSFTQLSYNQALGANARAIRAELIAEFKAWLEFEAAFAGDVEEVDRRFKP